MLLDAGAEVDAGDGWALYSASSEGHEGVVRILIEAGAAVNRKFLGQTALMGALRHCHVKIVQMLLDAGEDDTMVVGVRRMFSHECFSFG